MRRTLRWMVLGACVMALPGASAAEDLGDLLVQKGVVTRQELERLRREQQTSAGADAGRSAGERGGLEAVERDTRDLKEQVQALTRGGGIRFGGVNVKLGGFIEAATIFRTRNEVADVGSDYNGGIPFKNSPLYHQNELRFSARQSRLSILASGDVSKDTHLAAYYELDFLAAGVTSNSRESNSYTPRSRHVYATLDKDDWGFHLLAGQSWSLLTTNTKGIIPRQEQIPLTIDAQYVEGFDWDRNPQLRIVEDFGGRVWAGVSIESPQAVTSPIFAPNKSVNFTNSGDAGGLLNNSTTYSADRLPDFIGKVAVDPGFGHYEIKALGREFSAPSKGSNEHTWGFGIGGAVILPVLPGWAEVQASGLYGDGIGRYGSGQLPDVAFDANDKLEAITVGHVLAGIVAHPWSGDDMYFYYGYEHASRTGADSVSGYGAPSLDDSGCFTEGGSCSVTAPVAATTTAPITAAKPAIGAETEELRQITGGFWQDIYKGAYGRFVFGLQGGEIWRDAFAGIGGRPKTNIGIFMTSFRYYPF